MLKTANRNLATAIFNRLVEKGAELGNVSITFIKSVLDDNTTQVTSDKIMDEDMCDLMQQMNEMVLIHPLTRNCFIQLKRTVRIDKGLFYFDEKGDFYKDLQECVTAAYEEMNNEYFSNNEPDFMVESERQVFSAK